MATQSLNNETTSNNRENAVFFAKKKNSRNGWPLCVLELGKEATMLQLLLKQQLGSFISSVQFRYRYQNLDMINLDCHCITILVTIICRGN